MEQLVLGIFQEHLAKIIVGFRKEQVNANLLNGKGEIRDVSLNCSFFNEVIATVTPYIEFDSVHVSKLGFHVTSWANLRKAPIVVDIEHITATIHEPLRYIDKKHRKALRVLTEKELVDLIMKGLCKPFRGGVGAGGAISVTPYGFLDRILDNLTIDMKRLTINYQTWGRFKTKRFGPWTPPCLQLQWKHLKIVSVDDYGNEGTPEQVWAHNRHEHERFMLYKKISLECTSKLLLRPQQQRQQRQPSHSNPAHPSQGGGHLEIPLFKGAQVEVHAAIRRRLRDGAVLSVQLDVTLPRVEIDIEPHVVPLLAHMAAGFQYCFAKDRTFEDPLHEQSEAELASEPTISLAQESMSIASSMGSDDLDNDDEEEEEEELELKGEQAEDKLPQDDTRSVDSADVDEPAMTATSDPTSSQDNSSYTNRPIVMLPNGLIIYENICITMSIHHITVRGAYSSETDGYVQLLIKGLIAELIWPKVNYEMGGYGQLSLAYISLQERNGPRIRTILLGGMQHAGGSHHSPLEKAAVPPNEVNADENFPFFERRSIREDPLGLRYSFPSQAVGLKTTADLRKSAATDGSVGRVDVANITVNHEIGIDKFEIILDSDAWCRAICFALNEDGGGFDPRMHSGDWSNCMTRDMLLQPNVPLELDNHLQSVKQVFLDENLMLSSDLLNITSRVTNLEIRIPAAVQENARSCDILVKLNETILVVSSALPRTFLSGKIGTSINGDDPNQKAIIDFPNDPSDIAYALEQGEDPLLRQQGPAVSKNASTFRVQLTMRGFSVTHIPVIPFCIAPEPQQAIAPTDCNMIVCLEGELPDEGSNLVKIVLFISIEIYSIQVNVDLDLLAGAAGSLLHHKEVVQKTVETAGKIVVDASLASPEPPNSSSPSGKVKRNLRGRRVMVRRQLSRSRETGGLSVIFAMNMSNFGFTIWRQNVPVLGPLRQAVSSNSNVPSKDQSAMLRVLKIVRLSLQEFEVGIEFAYSADESRRLILKCCLGEGILSVCDLNAVLLELESAPKPSISEDQDESDIQSGSRAMIDILSFGGEDLPGGSSSEFSDRDQHFAMRLEEQLKDMRQWSLACDMTSRGIINLHVGQVKEAALLLIEALLLPTWSKRKVTPIDEAPFPDRTVGAFFYSLVTDLSVSRMSLKDIRWDSIEHKQNQGEADTTVERMLRVIFKLLLPSNLRLILLRVDLGNLLICVPSLDDSDLASSRCCGLLIHKSEIILRFYPVPGTRKSNMLDVLACKGIAWSSLIDTEEEGFYQKLSSRQSLVSVAPRNLSSSEVLVNPFNVSLSYVAARIALSMDNDLLIEDMRKVEEFVWQLLCFRENCEALQLELTDIFTAMRQSSVKDAPSCSTKMNDAPNIQAGKGDLQKSRNATSSIRSGRELMRQLSEELSQHDLNLRSALREKESQVATLKSLVFKKERERLGALSLMSSKVAGWIRMGGLHRTGERIEKISTMWPYWTVLRRSLLLMYLSPGDPKPADVVNLHGAILLELAGGRNRQDVKRGFAVVERTGTTRYFIASSSPQFALWTREIQKVVDVDGGKVPNDEETVGQLSSVAASFPPVPENQEDRSLSASEDPASPQRRRFGHRLVATKTRIGSALETARLKGIEVSEKRRLRKQGSASIDTLEDSFEEVGHSRHDTVPIQMDVLGTQSEETEPGQLQHDRSSGDDPLPESQVENNNSLDVPSTSDEMAASAEDTIKDDIDSEEVESSSRGRFGSKLAGVGMVTKSRLGSALQTARQRGKEVVERRKLNADDTEERQQGRVRGRLRGLLSGASDGLDEAPGSTKNEVLHENDASRNLAWTCPTCTFINNSENLPYDCDTCEMCGSAKPQSEEAQPDDETQETAQAQMEQAMGDEATLEPIKNEEIAASAEKNPELESNVRDGGARRGLFSGIRSTKTQSFERQNSASQGGDSRRAGRFAFRKRATDEEVFTDDAPLKLKNLRAGSNISSNADGDDDSEIFEAPLELKRLVGHWAVVVRSSQMQQGVKDSDSSTMLDNDTETCVNKNLEIPDSGQSDDNPSVDNDKDEGRNDVALTAQNEETEMSGDFRITIICVDSVAKSSPTESSFKLEDLLELHTRISECVANTLPRLDETPEGGREPSGEMSQSLGIQLGLSTFDNVMISGRILGGLLAYTKSSDIVQETRGYLAEVIEAFLNSVLECPLTTDAIDALTSFLGISASTRNHAKEIEEKVVSSPAATRDSNNAPSQPEVHQESATSNDTTSNDARIQQKHTRNIERDDRTRKIFGILSACEGELLRAENREMISQSSAVASTAMVPVTATSNGERIAKSGLPALVEPLLPHSITEHFHDAMHEALMNVMSERDEAHAQLIATNVLHVHELEQERKKNDRLERKLEAAEARIRAMPTMPPLFMNLNLNMDDKAKREAEAKAKSLQTYEDQAKQDSDAELLTLCQQLAGEISAKTAATLEIIRLKETRDIERKNEDAEKQALKAELKRVKELLAAQTQMHDEAQQDVNGSGKS